MSQSLNSEILARVADGSSIPLTIINSEHKVIHWNTALEALTGLKKDELIGTDGTWRPFYDKKRPALADLIVDGATLDEIRTNYSGGCWKSPLIEGAIEAEGYFPHFGKNGKWLHFTASPIKNTRGKLIGAVEIYEDITERKKAEENLQIYLKEITNAQEEERKVIARELHDDTVQVFGSLSRQIDNFLRKNNSLLPDDVTFLKNIKVQLNEGAHNLHRFCQGLRLSVLDDLGLIPALKSIIKGLQNSEPAILTDLIVIGEVRRFPPECESMMFRIVQEAVNNITKHAEASVVRITIKFMRKGIDFTINDNGQGFELKEKVDELPRRGKLGLAGIQERVKLLGGTLKIKTAIGQGTTLNIQIRRGACLQ